MNQKFDLKLAAMMLVFAEERSVSRTAMNKLLFFSDMASFLLTGNTISGDGRAIYQKKPYGPVPKSASIVRDLLIRERLLNENQEYTPVGYQFNYETAKKVSSDKVKERFDEKEMKIIDSVCKNLRGLTATSLSEKSHEFEPWKSGISGEDLDFSNARTDTALVGWLRNKHVIS